MLSRSFLFICAVASLVAATSSSYGADNTTQTNRFYITPPVGGFLIMHDRNNETKNSCDQKPICSAKINP